VPSARIYGSMLAASSRTVTRSTPSSSAHRSSGAAIGRPKSASCQVPTAVGYPNACSRSETADQLRHLPRRGRHHNAHCLTPDAGEKLVGLHLHLCGVRAPTPHEAGEHHRTSARGRRLRHRRTTKHREPDSVRANHAGGAASASPDDIDPVLIKDEVTPPRTATRMGFDDHLRNCTGQKHPTPPKRPLIPCLTNAFSWRDEAG
jgi:hypothetical protein